jgi:NADH:ubiquinone oxidoreductase subunit F (NADH-binding)
MTTAVPDVRPMEPGALRLLAGWAQTGAPTSYVAHRARYGPVPAVPDRAAAARLVDTVARAGLRGRGGGGFPTARKLAAVSAGRGPRIVVGNGCEGEPTSSKDRALLTVAPHLVIDGLQLAASAVAAREAILCVGEDDETGMGTALAERAGHDSLTVRLVHVPHRYIASEESALVRFLTTGDARPTATPPRPAQRGVRGRPTLVDNVETLAHLALIARYGAGWYRECGTDDSPGTTLVTVRGAVGVPGVYETAHGVPLGAVLDLAGGPAVPLQAVLVAGLGGVWLPLPVAAGVPWTAAGLRAAGLAGGVATLTALPGRACGLTETARALRHLAAESAGQCGPCMFGLPAVAADMAALGTGRLGNLGLARLRERLGVIPGRGACAHPDGAVRLAASALRVFADDVARHAAGMPCAWTDVPTCLPGELR